MTQSTRSPSPDQIRELVREGYTRVAEGGMCDAAQAAEAGRRIGYSDADLCGVPEGANLGAGCGNPTAIESLREGEVVVDLGSGAGMDAFLAARAVGPTGRVVGVDMTDAMLEKARANARKAGIENVEFRKGRIEELPLEDGSADVILSNCVVNLSPEKDRVYREAHRVLRPGGRLMVSDLVLERPLPSELLDGVEAYVGCVGGASLRDRYLQTIRDAGFRGVRIERESGFADAVSPENPLAVEAMERHGVTFDQIRDVLRAVTSVHVFARK